MKKIMLFFAFAGALFSAMACNETPDISGKWNILKVNGEEITVVEGTETPFVEFSAEEARVHGYSGVNIMNGSYTLEGKTLTFGNIATTMMAGPEENMIAERAVLDALSKVAKVSVDGEKLQLLDAEGVAVIELGK